jgi:hypothetical protein
MTEAGTIFIKNNRQDVQHIPFGTIKRQFESSSLINNSSLGRQYISPLCSLRNKNGRTQSHSPSWLEYGQMMILVQAAIFAHSSRDCFDTRKLLPMGEEHFDPFEVQSLERNTVQWVGSVQLFKPHLLVI